MLMGRQVHSFPAKRHAFHAQPETLLSGSLQSQFDCPA